MFHDDKRGHKHFIKLIIHYAFIERQKNKTYLASILLSPMAWQEETMIREG